MTRLARPLALLAALGLAPPAPAQDADADKAERRRQLLEGTHVLRRILFDHGFTSLQTPGQLAEKPEKTLLVVLGDLDKLEEVPGGLERFVRDGGALLAASDRAVSGEARRQLIAVSGVSINADTLICGDVEYTYRAGVDYSPRVEPAEGASPPLLTERRPRGAGAPFRVFTNVPSKLNPKGYPLPGRVRPLAMLPPGCLMQTPRGLIQPNEEVVGGQALFAVAGDVGLGRVLVMADHSVFINQMMLPTDTNNVEFSYAAVRWLQGDNQQRDRVLFYEDGQVQERLDIPLKSVNLPPEAILQALFERRNDLLAEADHQIARLEEDDAFNRKLFDALDGAGVEPSDLAKSAVVFGTLAGLMYLIYRLGIRGRFRHDTTVSPLAPAVDQSLPARPLTAQRQQALLKGGNLSEPAVALARRWFARLGADVEPGAGPPAFVASGGWWRRWRLAARLRRLWRLAAGRSPGRVGAAELWRLQRELDELRGAHDRGAWRVALPARSASEGSGRTPRLRFGLAEAEVRSNGTAGSSG